MAFELFLKNLFVFIVFIFFVFTFFRSDVAKIKTENASFQLLGPILFQFDATTPPKCDKCSEKPQNLSQNTTLSQKRNGQGLLPAHFLACVLIILPPYLLFILLSS